VAAADLQGEISALVQEMQNLEKALEEVSGLISSSTAKVEQIEKQTSTMLAAATNAVEHHEDDLGALGKQAQTMAEQLKTDVDHGTQLVTAEAAELASIAEKTFAAVDTAKTNVGHLTEAATQHAQEITAAMQHLTEIITTISTALHNRMQALEQTVTQGISAITELEHGWTQLGETTAQAIGDALHQTSDEIDQKFIAPLEDGIKQFQDLAKQIEDDVLNHPVTALADQLKSAILSEAQHEVEELTQQLQKLLDDAVHALTEAGSSNDAVSKEIRAVFHELEPVWNQLQDALRSVQSIWDTVKSVASVF
jgi:chromosome segregation ATPase